MALDNNPWVFRFEGRLWVSELPREQMFSKVTAQRAWDAANLRREHWGIAITIGAAVGTLATFGFGYLVHFPGIVDLLLAPIGFGIGAVLGAMVNRRFVKPRPEESSPRPDIPIMTKIPPSVARKSPEDASARELIDWSRRGYVG